jgi:hypothetical protein
MFRLIVFFLGFIFLTEINLLNCKNILHQYKLKQLCKSIDKRVDIFQSFSPLQSCSLELRQQVYIYILIVFSGDNRALYGYNSQ